MALAKGLNRLRPSYDPILTGPHRLCQRWAVNPPGATVRLVRQCEVLNNSRGLMVSFVACSVVLSCKTMAIGRPARLPLQKAAAEVRQRNGMSFATSALPDKPDSGTRGWESGRRRRLGNGKSIPD